jgi:hypothetical protein
LYPLTVGGVGDAGDIDDCDGVTNGTLGWAESLAGSIAASGFPFLFFGFCLLMVCLICKDRKREDSNPEFFRFAGHLMHSHKI